ncbi:MAG: hypothetical protein QOJ57_1983, partial [Thermoleophilaceae bacterium]|nr:hypothetical protein [Thermoleophilaceae bacterium]
VRPDFVAPDCEKVLVIDARFAGFTARPYPTRAGPRAVTFRFGCPRYVSAKKRGPCSGKLVLAETGGRGRLLGLGRVSRSPSARPVRATLTPLGRRLARKKSGVLATLTLKGKRLPSIGWTIRLRVRG